MTFSERHRWNDPVRFQFKTERTCRRCDTTRVTRHEPGQRVWIEFWRDGERIPSESTPLCDARLEDRKLEIAAS